MSTLIPKYYQGATGASNIPISTKLAETINVVDFGADRTGVADSTTAIQNAINAAGFGTCYFPDGVFKISSAITIPVGVKIVGTYTMGQNAQTSGVPSDTTIQGTKIIMSTASTSNSTSYIATPYGGAIGNYYASVNSNTGLSVGQLIKIAGCGWNGADLYTTITKLISTNAIQISNQFYNNINSAVVTTYSGTNIFNLANPGNAVPNSNLIQGIWFNGGYNQINSSVNGLLWATIRDCSFSGATNSGIFLTAFTQQVFLHDVEFYSSAYGIYYSPAGSQQLFDKNKFYNLYFNGQTVNCINIALSSGTGQGNEFYSMDFNYCVQDGAVFGGGLSNFAFVGLSSETIGYVGYANYSPPGVTTGTIASSTTVLTVSNAGTIVNAGSFIVGVTYSIFSVGNTNFTLAGAPNNNLGTTFVATAVGSGTGTVSTFLAPYQTITIQGAGANGLDLQAKIVSIGGNTVNIDTAATTSVTSQEVSNYVYSDVKCIYTNSLPARFTFIQSEIGILSSAGAVLYGLNAPGQAHTLCGYSGSRPINFSGSMIGVDSDATSLRNQLVSNETFQQSFFTSGIGFDRTQVASPQGGDIVLGLQATNPSTATGFGNWRGYIGNGNRTKVWDISGTTGVASFSSGVAPGGGSLGSFQTAVIFYATGSPQSTAPYSTATWVLGSKAFNSSPAVGQPKGWVCTVAGTPGTWVSEGNL